MVEVCQEPDAVVCVSSSKLFLTLIVYNHPSFPPSLQTDLLAVSHPPARSTRSRPRPAATSTSTTTSTVRSSSLASSSAKSRNEADLRVSDGRLCDTQHYERSKGSPCLLSSPIRLAFTFALLGRTKQESSQKICNRNGHSLLSTNTRK